MTRTRKLMVAGVAGVIVMLGAGGAALAAGGGDHGDDGDATVSGPQADRAVEAALEITGASRANSVERDSENGATWEVEVTKPDGETVDVRLDQDYHLVVVEGDEGS